LPCQFSSANHSSYHIVSYHIPVLWSINVVTSLHYTLVQDKRSYYDVTISNCTGFIKQCAAFKITLNFRSDVCVPSCQY